MFEYQLLSALSHTALPPINPHTTLQWQEREGEGGSDQDSETKSERETETESGGGVGEMTYG